MFDAELANDVLAKYNLDKKTATRYAAIIEAGRISDSDASALGTVGRGTVPSLGYALGFVISNVSYSVAGREVNQLSAWLFHSSGVDVMDSMWFRKSFGRFVLDEPITNQGRFTWGQIESFTVTTSPPYVWLEMNIASFEERPLVTTFAHEDLARAESEGVLCSSLLLRHRPEAHQQ